MKDAGKTCMATAVFFLTGAAIGSGIALLTARKTGRESRDYLKGVYHDAENWAKDYYDKGRDRFHGYYEKGVERFHDLREKAREAVKRDEVVHA